MGVTGGVSGGGNGGVNGGVVSGGVSGGSSGGVSGGGGASGGVSGGVSGGGGFDSVTRTPRRTLNLGTNGGGAAVGVGMIASPARVSPVTSAQVSPVTSVGDLLGMGERDSAHSPALV